MYVSVDDYGAGIGLYMQEEFCCFPRHAESITPFAAAK